MLQVGYPPNLGRLFVPLVMIAIVTGCSPLTPISAAFTVAEERTLKEVGDDAALKVKILDAFAEHGRRLLVPVGVDVYQGRVMLTGVVDRAEAQKQAEALTRAVKGVGEVINEIQVTTESGMKATAADLAIETKLQAKLAVANMVNSINYRWRRSEAWSISSVWPKTEKSWQKS